MLGPFLPSFRYINCIAYIANTVFIDYHLLPFLNYLTLNNIVTVKSWLEVTQGHSNWCHSKAWVRFPIRLP